MIISHIPGCRRRSGSAKSLRFQLARAIARKRFSGFEEALTPVADAYDALFAEYRADRVSSARARPQSMNISHIPGRRRRPGVQKALGFFWVPDGAARVREGGNIAT
jgi:hypothetical protein